MAIPEWLGWSTPLFSQLLGMVVFLATLAVSWRLARKVLGDDTLALLAVVVLLTNMTFLSYATGGLETMLQTLLVMSVLTLLLPVDVGSGLPGIGRYVGAGVLAGLAVLTRLDSVVLLATIMLVHLIQVLRQVRPEDRSRAGVRAVAGLGISTLAVVVPWLVWKLDYYGHLLPNTFEAKSGGNPLGQVLFVAVYFAAFFVGYFLFLLIGRWRRYRSAFFSLPGARQVFWLVPVWLLYIGFAGADFMEFRFMVPILPVLALLGAVLIDHFRRVGMQVALIAGLAFASIGHLLLPSLAYPVTTFQDLRVWPADSPHALTTVGEQLAATFPGGLDREDQVIMSIGSLGVVPYYSQLPTVDMVGLADRVVATEGEQINMYYPGHLRFAPLDYLVERQVNIVAAFPFPTDVDPERESYRLSELIEVYPVVDLAELPEEATVVEIPMDDETAWVAIYLTPHPEVDRAIEEEGWRQFPIERVCDPDDIPDVARFVGSRTCV
jgi:arabinofuranosyltransferase